MYLSIPPTAWHPPPAVDVLDDMVRSRAASVEVRRILSAGKNRPMLTPLEAVSGSSPADHPLALAGVVGVVVHPHVIWGQS